MEFNIPVVVIRFGDLDDLWVVKDLYENLSMYKLTAIWELGLFST